MRNYTELVIQIYDKKSSKILDLVIVNKEKSTYSETKRYKTEEKNMHIARRLKEKKIVGK